MVLDQAEEEDDHPIVLHPIVLGQVGNDHPVVLGQVEEDQNQILHGSKHFSVGTRAGKVFCWIYYLPDLEGNLHFAF